MRKVFISHPYISNPELNRKRAEVICKYAIRHGYLPLSPLHMFSFIPDDTGRVDIMHICFKLIDIADEVWVFGDSKGCRQERAYAERIKKPVRLFYPDIDYEQMMKENRFL